MNNAVGTEIGRLGSVYLSSFALEIPNNAGVGKKLASSGLLATTGRIREEETADR